MSTLDAIRARAEARKGRIYSDEEIAEMDCDIERLLKANDILRKELICSTNWYEAKCECCKPFGERAKVALAAADRALSETNSSIQKENI